MKSGRAHKIILVKRGQSSISFLLTVVEQMFLILTVIGGPVVLRHCGGGEGGKDFIGEEVESSLEQSPAAARGKLRSVDPREVPALLAESRMQGWYGCSWFKGQSIYCTSYLAIFI